MSVYVAENSYAGVHHYIVMVDGEKYDEFTSSKPLTFTEQFDVAAGYEEALNSQEF